MRFNPSRIGFLWMVALAAAFVASSANAQTTMTFRSADHIQADAEIEITTPPETDAPPEPDAQTPQDATPQPADASPPATEQQTAPQSATQPKAKAAPTPTVRAIPRAAAPMYGAPQPQVTNQTQQALNFYGGYSARTTLNQLPRRVPVQPRGSQPTHLKAKPFEYAESEPTVSPYLNLYRDDDEDESLPNYYAFVRPQLDQLEANRMQQRELQQLRGQVQGMGTPAAGYSSGGRVNSGPARYMDTAQFYSGWRR